MVYLGALLVAVSFSLLVYLLLKKKVKPLTVKNTAFIESSKKAGKSRRQFGWVDLQARGLKLIKTVNVSDEFRSEIGKDLNRLGWQHTPEDIRKMQWMYTSLFVGLSVFMFLISLLVGLIMLAFVPYVWGTPVRFLKDENKKRNDEFLLRLDELYALIYNTYKRNNSQPLADIVAAYYPTTSYLMKLELALFLRDLESGEEYALKQLKLRIPHPLVIRFCDLVSNNLEGAKNTDVMENFYGELKQIRDRRRRARNKKRVELIDKITMLLYVPFTFLVIVYLILMTVSEFV